MRRRGLGWAGTLTMALLACGCSQQTANTYQGYVEGEFVYMASSQAGQLVNLAVQRGQKVVAGALLFALEYKVNSRSIQT
ncbi:MAG TPA: secretion protein HlyD, partial [Nitrospiraceae bacterium]|nr:secretion protein HlyD [Nitrospiraceae bacterium]